MFRKAVFWLHLSAGVVAGLVVLTMSVTGVLLTYERQIKRWAAESRYVPAAEHGERLALEQLVNLQQLARPELQPTSLVITNDAGAPVSFRAGRQGGVDLNPYNGEPMQVESPALTAFFGFVTRFHRWFDIEGDNRAIARQVTGISNTIFLFLVLSGMYLWLPAMWTRALFKARLWLRSDYPSSKARDFHWHHVFGIWMALPLAVVVYTGMVISYPWAANFMYRVFGAELPQQQAAGPQQPAAVAGREGGQPVAREEAAGSAGVVDVLPIYQPLDALVATAVADASSAGWQRLTLTLPAADADRVQIEIDRGNGAQAQLRHTLSLDRQSGFIVGRRGFGDQPEAQRLRGIARFLHTGEVLGFWGQTVAGLASLAGVLLVWTGLALAYRRLLQPLFAAR